MQHKLISTVEYETQTVDALFDKYYFTDDSIGLKELVGIQYYNKAILKFADKQFNEAFQLGEKCYLFYPMEEMAKIMLASAGEILDRTTYDSLEDVELLAKVSRYTKFGVKNNDFENEYLRIINAQLINKGKIDYFNQVTDYLLNHIEDSVLKNDIDFYYNYELARYYYNKSYYSKSFPHAEKAMTLRKQNIDAQGLFIHNLLQKLNNETNGEVVINELDMYVKKYNYLKENELFATVKLHAYLYLMSQSFASNDRIKGEKYKNLFEIYYKDKFESIIDKSLIVSAYNSAAMYYFRNYKIAKAEVILEKGLKYVPNNYDLETRLRQIKKY